MMTYARNNQLFRVYIFAHLLQSADAWRIYDSTGGCIIYSGKGAFSQRIDMRNRPKRDQPEIGGNPFWETFLQNTFLVKNLALKNSRFSPLF